MNSYYPNPLRTINLEQIICHTFSAQQLADKIGRPVDDIYQMISGADWVHKPVTDEMARLIEEKLGLAAGWMDEKHKPSDYWLDLEHL